MKKEEILSNLCYYDKRNPEHTMFDLTDEELVEARKKDCYCDNCFYGRHKLAEYILELEGKTRIEIKHTWQ